MSKNFCFTTVGAASPGGARLSSRTYSRQSRALAVRKRGCGRSPPPGQTLRSQPSRRRRTTAAAGTAALLPHLGHVVDSVDPDALRAGANQRTGAPSPRRDSCARRAAGSPRRGIRPTLCPQWQQRRSRRVQEMSAELTLVKAVARGEGTAAKPAIRRDTAPAREAPAARG